MLFQIDIVNLIDCKYTFCDISLRKEFFIDKIFNSFF